MWMIHKLISKLESFIFPKSCFACKKKGESVCTPCLQKCRKSLDTPAPFIKSVYSFRDPIIKKIIHAIKYYHRRDLIEPLTEALILELKAISYQQQVDGYILIPIPMPLVRKYMRGYNHAECIATILGKKCDVHVDKTILTRILSPKRQVRTKNRNERLKNQHNSFKVVKNVSGVNIVLVDDVTTTGGTLIEARRVLLQAGARSVVALTLAH